MSKTLINFLQFSELPSKKELENKISEFGYNFKFISEFEKFDNLNQIDAIECKLNGHQIFIQIHQNSTKELLTNITYLKEELTHKDCAISFPFSPIKNICASMHIISLGLIELCQSNVLHAHDRMFYSRETLIQNISSSLKYSVVERHNNSKNTLLDGLKSSKKRNENIKIFIVWASLFLVTLFMNGGIISWATPFSLFILITTQNQIYLQRRKRFKK